ncbi:MAG: TonB-dependent hemoglobin/transferrin/lactoferrin family receptor [Pseudomonadota bacterium]
MATVVVTALYASLAVAQTAEDATVAQEEGTDDGGASLPILLNPISVTATRNPIEAFEYPGMVSVIGREEIETLQPSTPDDILKWVPGVQFLGGPRRTGEVPVIRGFSGPDTVVLIDGARQNFGSAHDGRFFIDPSLIQQVEVLRGPASALYGSGGTGGVIEFRTLDAADFLSGGDTYGGTVSGGFQTVNDEWVGTLTAYTAPTDQFDILGSITKRDSGDIKLGDGNTLANTDDDIIAGLATGGFNFADYHRIEGSYITFRNDAQEPNNGQGAGGLGIVDKDIRSSTYQVSYDYSNPMDNLLDLDVIAYFTETQADELRLDNLGIGPAGQTVKRDVDTYGFRIDNRTSFDTSDDVANIFTYGVEFYHDKQFGASGSGTRAGVPNAEDYFYGVFLQSETTITEPFGTIPGELLIVPGIRYDDYEVNSSLAAGNSDSEWSPRLGVSYLPNDWLMVFGSYSEAFRAPTFNELYLTGTHFNIVIPGIPTITNNFIPNPDLKPQRTRTWEFGGGLTFEDVLTEDDGMWVKGSYYRTYAKDLINLSVTQPAPFVDCNPFIPGACNGTTEADNIGNAKLWGTEVEGVYENDRFLVSLGFSTIRGKDEDTGAYVGSLQPDTFTVITGLKLPEVNSIVGWRMLAADGFDKVNTPGQERGGYAVHDFYAAWQPPEGLLQGFRVDVGVDNAFDKSYSRVFTGSVEAGRNYKALVSYSMIW